MCKRSAAEQTAFGPMVIAACEQYTPPERRLIDDDLALRFLPADQRLIVRACRWAPLLVTATERQATGLWGSMLCRKRYLDDQVREALAAGIDQVVVLGVGMDTRAYRLTDPKGTVHAFELDLPANTAEKRRRVRQVLGDRAGQVALVPLGLGTDELLPAIEGAGFDRSRPAVVVVWEAVTQYLTEDAVRRTLAALSDLAAGSWLLFTYIRQDFLDGTRLYDAGTMHDRLVGRYRVWHFGIDPDTVAALLDKYGWTLREQLGPIEYRDRDPVIDERGLAVSEIERCVLADRT